MNTSCWVTCSSPLAVCPLVIGTTPVSVYFARSLLLLCYERGIRVGLDSVWNESWTATQPSYLIPPPPFFHFDFSNILFIAQWVSWDCYSYAVNAILMTHSHVAVCFFGSAFFNNSSVFCFVFFLALRHFWCPLERCSHTPQENELLQNDKL